MLRELGQAGEQRRAGVEEVPPFEADDGHRHQAEFGTAGLGVLGVSENSSSGLKRSTAATMPGISSPGRRWRMRSAVSTTSKPAWAKASPTTWPRPKEYGWAEQAEITSTRLPPLHRRRTGAPLAGIGCDLRLAVGHAGRLGQAGEHRLGLGHRIEAVDLQNARLGLQHVELGRIGALRDDDQVGFSAAMAPTSGSLTPPVRGRSRLS